MGHMVTNRRAKPPIALKVARMRRATGKGDGEKCDKWFRVTGDTTKPEVLNAFSALASLTRQLIRFLWLSLGSEDYQGRGKSN